MASELLAPGSNAATSSDFAVSALMPVTVGLKGADGDNAPSSSLIRIQLKGDGGHYYYVDELSGTGQRATVITAAGTYRFSRPAGPVCGVYEA